MDDSGETTILRAINQWCRHDLDDCGMSRSRYDNCLCKQQAASVVAALNAEKISSKIGRLVRAVRDIVRQ